MINEKIELFLENNRALKDVKGSWNVYDLMKKSNALVSTIKNEKIDPARIDEALEIIKKNTSMFSSFRGLSKLTTAVTIAAHDNMEESLNKILYIYKKLKEKFRNNQYLVIVSQVIFNAGDRIDADEAVQKTREAYDYMKKHHRFLTGDEDMANAAIIATTSSNLEETFNEIEECYNYLKNYGIATSNNIQSLSHILSLINVPFKEKCDAVLKMNSFLKDKKIPLKNYSLSMLGIVSFISEDKNEIADLISETSMKLKREKGFGNFSLGYDNRNMIAAALVTADYIDNMDDNIRESLVNNANNITLTIAIAMETAVMLAASTAAMVSANSSS